MPYARTAWAGLQVTLSNVTPCTTKSRVAVNYNASMCRVLWALRHLLQSEGERSI